MVIMITTGLRVRLRRLLLLFGLLVSAGLRDKLGLGMLLVLRVFCKDLQWRGENGEGMGIEIDLKVMYEMK
jgi:hypothetical protein